jgi:hypothetical protein
MPLTQKRTVSEAKLRANRANGARSTGPKTTAGRANSAAANLRHGYYARSADALPALGESAPEFKRRLQSLMNTYRPADALQMALVFRIARSLWRLDRFDRVTESMTVDHLEKAEQTKNQIEALKLIPLINKLERLKPFVYSLLNGKLTTGPVEIETFAGLRPYLSSEMAAQALQLMLRLRAPGTSLKLPATLQMNQEEVPAAEGEERKQWQDKLLNLLAPELNQTTERFLQSPDEEEVQRDRDVMVGSGQAKTQLLTRGENSCLRQLREATNLLMKLKKWEGDAKNKNMQIDPNKHLKTNDLTK